MLGKTQRAFCLNDFYNLCQGKKRERKEWEGWEEDEKERAKRVPLSNVGSGKIPEINSLKGSKNTGLEMSLSQ